MKFVISCTIWSHRVPAKCERPLGDSEIRRFGGRGALNETLADSHLPTSSMEYLVQNDFFEINGQVLHESP